ncbi:pyridoxamine 5'-phosphate oxidase-like FMN-binding protein [Rhodococcus erythropolis CCM2595]|uniref:pyridoxamine 5'-phosphate oxidase family protein n=1 Tax=Rhodococcus erythropolis TaxID=1833 RepID=UPI00038DC4BB|nr:pyridoxamine 5'-phosphate oxidase family protein [Rhodococcus erythropolis]AGT94658.1 pyridoxamine 5'-phosphate oxidase-like FMN-binding protein [Rhodococcus erythropolis CCM2595]SUE10982.1 pyridoxamine 5'-phosphate oxidase-like FMN-binding protein [Rhodococcus erythropolis]
MGRVYEGIDEKLTTWLQAQPLFVVATAPLSPDGLINCSPKGGVGSFVVLTSTRVAYLDLTGSGVETIAHVRENSRITLMFLAFDGPPKIVRLHGHGQVLPAGAEPFNELVGRFPEHPGLRSIVVVDLTRISDSCGYAVPLMDYQSDRDVLDRVAEKRGPERLIAYRAEKNAKSVDGLPGLDPE